MEKVTLTPSSREERVLHVLLNMTNLQAFDWGMMSRKGKWTEAGDASVEMFYYLKNGGRLH